MITPGPSAPTTLDGSPEDYTITTGGGKTYVALDATPTKRISVSGPVCFRALSFVIEGGRFVPKFSMGGASSTQSPDDIVSVTVTRRNGLKTTVGG